MIIKATESWEGWLIFSKVEKIQKDLVRSEQWSKTNRMK